jgi:hypothetical protein
VQVKTSITARLEREARDRRDIEIIELNAESLHREAMDASCANQDSPIKLHA